MNELISDDSSKTESDMDTPPKYVQPTEVTHPAIPENEREKMKELIDRINRLEKDLNEQKEYEKALKEFEKKITTETDYVTKPVEAMETYLLGSGQLITKFLNKKQQLPDYYVDKIPRLFFDKTNRIYKASLTGVQTHHHEFELLLQRVSYLAYQTKRMQYDYKKEIDRSIDSTQMTLMKKRIRQTDIWKTYT